MEGGKSDSSDSSRDRQTVSQITQSTPALKKRMHRFLSRLLTKHQNSSSSPTKVRAVESDGGMEFENPYATQDQTATNNVSKVSNITKKQPFP